MTQEVDRDVLISYSSRDKESVRTLASELDRRGVRVWLDEWEIRVGDPIVQKIEQGLQSCEYLAVWLTRSAIDSGWVQREWQSRFQHYPAFAWIA